MRFTIKQAIEVVRDAQQRHPRIQFTAHFNHGCDSHIVRPNGTLADELQAPKEMIAGFLHAFTQGTYQSGVNFISVLLDPELEEGAVEDFLNEQLEKMAASLYKAIR